MYDPDEEQSPYMNQAAQAAEPGKYGANEGDVSRFAAAANKLNSGIKQPPPTKTIGVELQDSGGHGLPVVGKQDAAQAAFGPDNPSALADHHEAQAELYKPQMGPTANPADDTPSATIAQASSKGKYGQYGASAGDIMSMLG